MQQWEIYETTNTVNQKTYIGQHRHTTTCMGKKLTRICKYKGSGVAIQRAIKKYGTDSFVRKILSIETAQADADKAEREQIALAKAQGKGQYNLYDGHRTDTPAINRNISYRDEPYRHSEDRLKKLRENAKEKWATPEGRGKMMKNHNTVVGESMKKAAREATIRVWGDPETAEKRRIAVKIGNLRDNHLKGRHENKARNLPSQKNREDFCPLC